MKIIYVLHYEPHGTPSSIDGEWSGPIEAFESKERAEDRMAFIESNADPNLAAWLGTFEEDQDGIVCSDRGYTLAIARVSLYTEDT